MFERVVLAAFFIKYPDQAKPYAYFSTVEQRKNLIRALKMYSGPEHRSIRERLQERVKELDNELKVLKQRYGKQFSHKWIGAAFDKLCEEVGLKSEFLYSYLIPNTFVHASPSQLLEAVAREQQYFVESGPDRANADEALKSAHSLLVWSFAVADNLLKLHMAAEVKNSRRNVLKFTKTDRADWLFDSPMQLHAGQVGVSKILSEMRTTSALQSASCNCRMTWLKTT